MPSTKFRLLFGIIVFLQICLSFLYFHWPLYPMAMEVGPSLVQLPVDYSLAFEDTGLETRWCSIYGPQYLTNFTERHISYCEKATSHSDLECFRSRDEETNKQKIDSFCVARRVSFDPNRDKQMHLSCQERNWKASESTTALPQLSQFPAYFTNTGAGPQLNECRISSNSDISGCNNRDKAIMLIKLEGGGNLWHTLMELWSAMLTLDVLQMSSTYGNISGLQIVFQNDEATGPVSKLWTILTGNPSVSLNQLSPGCFGTVILPLPGGSNPFWQSHWEPHDCKGSILLSAFMHRMYKQMSLQPQQRLKDKITVTIIDRRSTRKIINLENYVVKLGNRYPEINIQSIDLAELSIKEQFLIMHETDVLVGVIGAGMAHILALPQGSAVVEIMPPKIKYEGFRNLAKLRSVLYYTYHSQVGKGSEAEGLGLGEFNWQHENIYIQEVDFIRVIDVDIQSQLNRGLLDGDIILQREDTL